MPGSATMTLQAAVCDFLLASAASTSSSACFCGMQARSRAVCSGSTPMLSSSRTSSNRSPVARNDGLRTRHGHGPRCPASNTVMSALARRPRPISGVMPECEEGRCRRSPQMHRVDPGLRGAVSHGDGRPHVRRRTWTASVGRQHTERVAADVTDMRIECSEWVAVDLARWLCKLSAVGAALAELRRADRPGRGLPRGRRTWVGT